jgi:uncharacterized membrane protein YhaH (DUF805 family)
MIAFLLPPWALDIASGAVDPNAFADKNWIAISLSIAANAVSAWAIIELGLRRGTNGANQYGEDPIASSEQTMSELG